MVPIALWYLVPRALWVWYPLPYDTRRLRPLWYPVALGLMVPIALWYPLPYGTHCLRALWYPVAPGLMVPLTLWCVTYRLWYLSLSCKDLLASVCSCIGSRV